METFAYNKININEEQKTVLKWVENILGKRQKAGSVALTHRIADAVKMEENDVKWGKVG